MQENLQRPDPAGRVYSALRPLAGWLPPSHEPTLLSRPFRARAWALWRRTSTEKFWVRQRSVERRMVQDACTIPRAQHLTNYGPSMNMHLSIEIWRSDWLTM